MASTEKVSTGLDAKALRLAFEEDEDRQTSLIYHSRIKAARLMVLAMTGSSDFSVEDFLFAATLGREKKYKAEAETLGKLNSLKANQLVGVFEHGGELEAIGLTAEKPFTMYVHTDRKDVDFHRDDNRKMMADVVFSSAAKREYRGNVGGPKFTMHADPSAVVPVDVLHSSHEPDKYSGSGEVFYLPSTIAIGGLRVISGIVETDTVGQTMAEAFIDTALASVDIEEFSLKLG